MDEILRAKRRNKEVVTRIDLGKDTQSMNLFKRFINDDAGIGVVELILILVVLIGLVVIFRDQLTSIIGDIFERISSESGAI